MYLIVLYLAFPKLEYQNLLSAQSKIPPSLHKSFSVSIPNITWNDIGGYENIKYRIKQIIEWPIIYKEQYKLLNIKNARGLLLYGPPGCCKTMLVKALVNSIKYSFYSLNGAELYSPYFGETELTIRNLFKHARSSSPSIIFFDEIESLVSNREKSNKGSSLEVFIYIYLLFYFLFYILHRIEYYQHF